MNLKTVGRNCLRHFACLLGAGLLMAFTAGAQNFNLNVLTSFSFLTNNTGVNPRSTLVQGPDGTLYGTAENGPGNGPGGSVFKLNPDGSGFTVLHNFTGGADGSYPDQATLLLAGNTLYGTTWQGGAYNQGVVFAVNTDGTGFTVLYSFGTAAFDGAAPQAGLTLVGTTLYGTTTAGGLFGEGTVFAINPDGTGFTNLYSFSGAPDGNSPGAKLILVGNALYGTTQYGGQNNQGMIFAINPDGSGYTDVYDFAGQPGGSYPAAGLALSGNTLYGTTQNGGDLGNGSVFAVNTNGTGYTTLYSFEYSGADGAYPTAEVLVSSNVLYGTTTSGGNNDNATVFSINTDGTGYTNLYFFTNTPDGSVPFGGLVLSSNTLYGTTFLGGTNYGGTVFAINTDGSGYTVVFNNFISGYTSANPYAGLILSGSTLYGTSAYGGPNRVGSVFAVNTNGTGYTVLHTFSGYPVDGYQPFMGQLTLIGNTLYGTTYEGGTNGQGTIFAVNTDGTGFTNLYNFGSVPNDGFYPIASLTLAGSTLYGTTQQGGVNDSGTVFAINTDGTGYTNFFSFGFFPDAEEPFGPMIISGNTLYGTTSDGGINGDGTVFSLNTDGTGETALYSFGSTATDGQSPYGELTLSGSTLYGTTSQGGTSGAGVVFALNTDGTGYTNLYSFTGHADGGYPQGGLALAGNTLYGMAANGGPNYGGTVFTINTDGTDFTVLHGFNGGSDGGQPYPTPLLVGNTLYGTTYEGGALGVGTVFSLSATPPITANNNTYTRNGLNTWRIKVSDLLTNATDLNSNTLSLANVGTTTNGISLVISYGYVQYYNTNLVDDQFTYSATDTNGALSTGVITLTANNPTGGQINNITVTGSSVSLTFAGIPSYLYHVQVSTNLVDWTTLETTNAPSNGIFQFMDSNPPQPSAFYRLMWSGN